MLKEQLVERAAQIGDTRRKRFLAWHVRFPWIGDVRGLGAMQGIVEGAHSMGPDSTRADTAQQEALSRGLLILTAGMYGNVLRTLLPIGITDDLLEACAQSQRGLKREIRTQ